MRRAKAISIPLLLLCLGWLNGWSDAPAARAAETPDTLASSTSEDVPIGVDLLPPIPFTRATLDLPRIREEWEALLGASIQPQIEIHNGFAVYPNGMTSLHLDVSLARAEGEKWIEVNSERPSPASNPSMSARQKAGLPDALAEIDSFTLGESKLIWRAYRCLDDHLIDVGAFYPTRHYVQAWTFAQLVCPASQQVEFIVKVGGAAAIWLNGQQLLQQEQCQGPHAITVDAPLQAGHNQILARLDTVARGD